MGQNSGFTRHTTETPLQDHPSSSIGDMYVAHTTSHWKTVISLWETEQLLMQKKLFRQF